MARRKSRRSYVKGKPNYVWISSAGEIALVSAGTSWDATLIPGDWSGTVTEGQCTLLRMVVSCYTEMQVEPGPAMAQNAAIVLGNASEAASFSVLDMSDTADWPDFFAAYDRVLRIFRLEWAGSTNPQGAGLAVQFSQLPDPVMNLKTPRVLKGDDSIHLAVGGNWTQQQSETPVVHWFCRSLVRVGLR